MTSLNSIQSLELDIPPSCIEFCLASPNDFVVGTYLLEKKEQDANSSESDVAEVEREEQKRTGSLILFRIDGDKVKQIHVRPTPYAILDIHFSPHDPTLLCVAASTGLLELFRLDKDTSSLRSERVIQITDPSILVLSLTWHPTSPTTVGVTLSSGEVQTCDLAPPTATTTTAEAATKTILQHELEAWTLAFSPAGTAVFSGGDDAALRFAAADAGSEWADRRSHGAGVTAILPLAREADVLVTGSYDDRIRVVRAPAVGRRQVLAEEELGGGVWRLKLLQGEAEVGRYVVLASCMHAGARVVGIERDGDGEWQIRVLAKFEEHKSMNYGSDVRPGDGALKTIVSTSFYDKLLCLWRYELA